MRTKGEIQKRIDDNEVLLDSYETHEEISSYTYQQLRRETWTLRWVLEKRGSVRK
jgi:hypothetical protein